LVLLRSEIYSEPRERFRSIDPLGGPSVLPISAAARDRRES